MISIDDALIQRTDRFGPFGPMPIVQAFDNIVPHFIWKDKPQVQIGNLFAHEVGILAEADESTGISFSSTASSFHIMGWKGDFLLAPATWFFFFLIFDLFCVD